MDLLSSAVDDALNLAMRSSVLIPGKGSKPAYADCPAQTNEGASEGASVMAPVPNAPAFRKLHLERFIAHPWSE